MTNAKKVLSILLSLMLMLGAFSLPCFVASAEEYNGFLYEISDGCVTITGYTGESTAVEIPSAVNGTPVTGIAQDAFKQKSIGSVTIPDSVKSIGEEAFFECESLSNVTLGSGIESIGNRAFYYCPITAIEIPGSVKSIGEGAFFECESLSNVALGSGIESIGNYAFYGCSVTAIEIPGSVKSIGDRAFRYCSSLGSVTLGSGIESIGDAAFRGCPITSIIIPNSVNTIGNGAFKGCDSLTDVYYIGSQVGWDSIYIGDENDPLLDADIHFIGEPGITSHALVLSGEIGVVFNIKVPSDFEGALKKVTFSVGKNGRSEMTLSDAVYNTGSGAYEFVCYTGAYNMADIITPTIVYTINNKEFSAQGEPYSAKDYIDYVRSHTGEYNDSVVALVNALADYGHYSQIYLGDIHGYTCGDGEDDKYAAMTTYAAEQYDYSAVLGYVADKAPSAQIESEKVSKASFTLDLESKTNLYIDLQVKDGVVPDSATLTNGTVLPVSKKAGNVYRVSINGINAIDLFNKYVVTVKAGGETIATVTVSPMSYVYKVLSAQEGPLTEGDIRDTVCALYAFSYAAANVPHTGVVNPPDPYGPVEPAGPSPYNPG